jgi:hypothetical protein
MYSVRWNLILIAGLLLGALTASASADLTYTMEGTTTIERPDAEEAEVEEFWYTQYFTEDNWRRDQFVEEPGEGVEPDVTVIRYADREETAILTWEARQAQILPDETIERLDDMLAQLKRAMENVPDGFDLGDAFEMPSEVKGMLSATKPVIAVTVEGPLGTDTIAGLACDQYRVVTEVRDPEDAGDEFWGHTIETSDQWITEELVPPITHFDPELWDATRQAILYLEAWEEATAGLDMPPGVAAKSITVSVDQLTDVVTTTETELTEHHTDAIGDAVFEIPEDFEVTTIEAEGMMMPGMMG